MIYKEELVEYYPAAIYSEQDTNESYWHNLSHLLPQLKFLEWMELSVRITKERRN